jgi:hypothetical protein
MAPVGEASSRCRRASAMRLHRSRPCHSRPCAASAHPDNRTAREGRKKMPSTTFVDLSRFQFARTAAFDMTLPALSVGLSILLVICCREHERVQSDHSPIRGRLHGPHMNRGHARDSCLTKRSAHERRQPNKPPRDTSGRPRFGRDVRTSGCWHLRHGRRRSASPAVVISRPVGLARHGRAGTPVVATAIAVEQKIGMDRCRCPDGCGDRTFRRSRQFPYGNSHLPSDDCRAPRARQQQRSRIRRAGVERSVRTCLGRSSRHGRQRHHVGFHDVDIRRSRGDR